MARCGKYTRCFCRERRSAAECVECDLLRKSVYVWDRGVKLKLCKHCGRFKPLHGFYLGVRKDGREVYSSQCRMCITDRLREKRHGRLSPGTNNGRDEESDCHGQQGLHRERPLQGAGEKRG